MNRFPLALLAIVLLASQAQAQNTGDRGRTNIPQPIQVPGGTQLTPDQMRDVMVFRALQNRRGGMGGGVRTGVPPQFVPFGGGFGPSMMPMREPEPQQPQANRKPSAQQKLEARKAREEERKEALAKTKEKNLKAAAARGKAKAKPAAATKPAAKQPADAKD